MVESRMVRQRREALLKANATRVLRAELKRDLRAGRRQVSELLADPPEWLLAMPVRELLLAVPRLGRVKIGRELGRAQVAPSKTVGGLTGRQRDELLSGLRAGVRRAA